MGVPAFFRWLSRKYPSIIVNCIEQKAKEVDGQKVPVDTSQPNPNDYEFDNLYLDMNGIIHPCCHPEDKPAPKNEDEMMVLIFEFIDRIFSIVRPRKVLYMAIDGVAPRAKMNQQRSRRFRASKETVEKKEEMAEMRAQLEAKGCSLPPPKPPGEHFDSNCITPGTPFMFKLAECLIYYIYDRLNTDPGWQNIKIILSDANSPGEGEHKIMDYIRKQRAQPDHDPNTKHCLCGADADLIMLGLATHEPHFTIIREEFKPNQPRPCELCGQIGHEMKECAGLPKEKTEKGDEVKPFVGEEQQYIFVRLNILREYLERELVMENLSFPYDFERALDDWVLMCFFVGNDFLPHLPSLEIREGAIDRLQRLYKDCVRKTGGYLTENGVLDLSRVQLVLSELGEVEDEIFKSRRSKEMYFKQRDRENKLRAKRMHEGPKWIPGGALTPQPLGHSHSSRGSRGHSSRDSANSDAAQALKAMMRNPDKATDDKAGKEDEEEPEPQDDVKLWEAGWKDRYYRNKFNVGTDDIEFRHNVANHYVRGLCWVLRYYYQGCPSWKWYFPYHYAPFASDFVNIGDLSNSFEANTEPFKPLEQLMGVFPAGSKEHLPVTWQRLMTDPESPIIDFYPVDFKIDLNGKKYAWQGVALLPFVDEKRLLSALATVYPDLTSGERKRNTKGSDRMFVGIRHPVYTFFEGLYEGTMAVEPVDMDPKLTQGLSGKVWCDETAVMTGGTVMCPVPTLHDTPDNRAIGVHYLDPVYEQGYIYKANVLPGAEMPPRVLKPEDFNKNKPWKPWVPHIGMSRGGSSNRGARDIDSALRMIRHGTGGGGGHDQRGQWNSGRSDYRSHGGGGGPPSLLSLGGNGGYGGRGQQRGGYNQGYGEGRGGGQHFDSRSNYSGGGYGNQRSNYGNQGGNYGNQRGNYGGHGGSYGGGYGNQSDNRRDNRGGGHQQHQPRFYQQNRSRPY
ncbi:5'-3' exoribonuclease 2-like [Pecten maximus]|uniref:5'-3' exoribonuclease 2-like n=1 Tax=Pecten maximus TaxID=6579 RepID=UPI0014580529|nr:5'-3' exoribonuclease 2-like [Pecten maximus]